MGRTEVLIHQTGSLWEPGIDFPVSALIRSLCGHFHLRWGRGVRLGLPFLNGLNN